MGFEPKDCAVVEDSLSGVKAGIAGGFDVYAIVHEHNKQKFQDLGVTTFSSMGELYKLLAIAR